MTLSDAVLPWERPLGARPLSGAGQTSFRVWAPRARRVELSLGERRLLAMEHAGLGVYELVAPACAGDDYFFCLDGRPLPDPASRWQPRGLRGPSRVFSPAPATGAQLAPLRELVLYELHIGTFSAPGTFEGAIAHLDELAALGVNAVELMPIGEFPGARGWGYDGVYISAAHSAYGGPHGLQRLIDEAHRRGLGVILDVVYNHVGASGADALEAFGPYFSDRFRTPWGRAINFDDVGAGAVREWVCQSAEGWVSQFGIDGLRIDAVHAICDSSAEHIVAEIARRVHAVRADALVIAESALNDPRVVRPRERGGYACDGAWADDFHHALHTLVTDERDGYYADFGRVASLAKAMHRPYVHDGCYSSFRGRRFGASADDVPPERFVVFCQNHDQVGNRPFGDRLPAPARPLAAFCTLLAPFVPMLFMGEEYGERAPFQFFCDHIDPAIAAATREGRRREFAAFASFGQQIPDPQDPATFAASKLTRVPDQALADLYRQLLALRRRIAPEAQAREIAFDEDARWLRLRRGGLMLACNFAHSQRGVPVGDGGRLVLATHPGVVLADGRLTPPALAGAAVACEDDEGSPWGCRGVA